MNQRSNYQDATSVFKCRKCAATNDVFANQVEAEVDNVADDYINQADLNSKHIEPYEEEHFEISTRNSVFGNRLPKDSGETEIDDDSVDDKDQYVNRGNECKTLDTIAVKMNLDLEMKCEMETGDMEIGKEQLCQSRYEVNNDFFGQYDIFL